MNTCIIRCYGNVVTLQKFCCCFLLSVSCYIAKDKNTLRNCLMVGARKVSMTWYTYSLKSNRLLLWKIQILCVLCLSLSVCAKMEKTMTKYEISFSTIFFSLFLCVFLSLLFTWSHSLSRIFFTLALFRFLWKIWICWCNDVNMVRRKVAAEITKQIKKFVIFSVNCWFCLCLCVLLVTRCVNFIQSTKVFTSFVKSVIS